MKRHPLRDFVASSLSRAAHGKEGAAYAAGQPLRGGPMAPLHKSPRRVHLRSRAVCVVANVRNSYGYNYCCALRPAAHPDPQCTLANRFGQRLPSAGRAGFIVFW